jgi:DNA polymerase
MAEFPSTDARHPLADDCTRCPALAESRTCISWGNGALDASVVVVGEAPATGDPDADRWRGGNHTGMAYTSRHSGRAVRDLCADAGLDVASECYFTNAVKCFPRKSDGDGNRQPTAEELANCRPHLRVVRRRTLGQAGRGRCPRYRVTRTRFDSTHPCTLRLDVTTLSGVPDFE